MANILYFSDICPDTGPMVAELRRLGLAYEEANISSSMAHLRGFLRLRDQSRAFAEVKANGRIGIPALVLENEVVILDWQKVKDFV